MATAERIDEVGTLERCGRLLGRIGVEGPSREKPNRLRDGGLEEAAVLRVCAAVCR